MVDTLLLILVPCVKVYDGINMKTCQSGPGTTFTYTAGTLLGGLAEKFKLERKNEDLDLAHNITLAAFK